MSQYFELLNSNVYDKKNIVTYRWLSRKLNVNVNQAKRILYEFKVNENDKVHCVYCISGQLKEANELTFELIPEEKLEEAKKKFLHSFIHIYSVEAQNLKELDPLVSENYDIINDEEDNPQNYSMIKCDTIHKKEKQIEISSIDEMQNVKSEKSNYSSGIGALKEIKSEKNDFFKKTTNNKKNKSKDAKTAFFEKFKTKTNSDIDNIENKNSSNQKQIKKESKNPMDMFLKKKSEKSEKPIKQEFESEHNSTVEKERKIEVKNEIVVEIPKLSEEDKMLEEENKNKEHEKEIEEENEKLRHLFDDDDNISGSLSNSGKKRRFIDDEDDEDDENDKKEVNDEEDDNFNIISNEIEEKPKPLVKIDDTRKPGRKRYRVTKQRTFQDERGYLVTEDYSDWESASEPEENTSSAPLQSKQNSLFNMHGSNNNSKKRNLFDDDKKVVKKRRNNTEKTQKSILSFFGKH